VAESKVLRRASRYVGCAAVLCRPGGGDDVAAVRSDHAARIRSYFTPSRKLNLARRFGIGRIRSIDDVALCGSQDRDPNACITCCSL
jgi:hypothetical protein